MRRLSIHRPDAKVRGIKRRLRALDRWASGLSDIALPSENQRFLNFKIPVLDRLICPPTTTGGIQKRAFESLLKGAVSLADSARASKHAYYRTAVLLVLPDMFQSEVTVFFDSEYYDSFCYKTALLSDKEAPSRLFNVDIPEGFIELGTLVEWEDEFEPGQPVKFSEARWTVGQAP